jgi:PleD family two-component response regulator
MNNCVIALVDDMFFAAKIRGTAERLGIEVIFVRSLFDLQKSVGAKDASLLIVDLQAQRCDPFAVVESLKSEEHFLKVPVVGFFSHVQTEFQRRALESGVDYVMPRSVFTKKLPDILQGKLVGDEVE